MSKTFGPTLQQAVLSSVGRLIESDIENWTFKSADNVDQERVYAEVWNDGTLHFVSIHRDGTLVYRRYEFNPELDRNMRWYNKSRSTGVILRTGADMTNAIESVVSKINAKDADAFINAVRDMVNANGVTADERIAVMNERDEALIDEFEDSSWWSRTFGGK